MYQFGEKKYIFVTIGLYIMREGIVTREAGRVSRNLSWNYPTKKYYSDAGRVICPACNNDVNVRDLIEKRGIITCKMCKI